MKTWTLCDVDQDLYIDQITIRDTDVGGPARGYSVVKKTLRGGLRDGVDVVEVNNGVFRFTVLPTRGMGIWQARHADLTLGWQAPVKGPVHPKFVPIAEPNGLGWLRGFDELICRCGLESNGGPDFDEAGKLVSPLHGRIANLPAHKVEVSIDGSSGEIAVTGVVDESCLYHNKLRLRSTVRTRVGQFGFDITDEVTNLSAEPGELELLYHTNFGRPILDEGAHVVLPAKTIVPCNQRAADGVNGWYHYLHEQTGYAEQVYFFELLGDDQGQSHALLRNSHGNHGVSLGFNLQELPWFTVWKSTQMGADGYVTGLEPGMNLPNPKSFERKQGRVTQLAGHEQRTCRLNLTLHPDAESVAQMERKIQTLQGSVKPKTYEQPAPPWSKRD